MSEIPVKGWTPYDLTKYAEMVGRLLARRPVELVVERIETDAEGRPVAVVVVEMEARPKLRVELKEEPS